MSFVTTQLNGLLIILKTAMFVAWTDGRVVKATVLSLNSSKNLEYTVIREDAGVRTSFCPIIFSCFWCFGTFQGPMLCILSSWPAQWKNLLFWPLIKNIERNYYTVALGKREQLNTIICGRKRWDPMQCCDMGNTCWILIDARLENYRHGNSRRLMRRCFMLN